MSLPIGMLEIMYSSVVLQLMLNGKFSQECIFTLVGTSFITVFMCQTASAQQQVGSSNDPSNSPINNLRNLNGKSAFNFALFPSYLFQARLNFLFGCLFFPHPSLYNILTYTSQTACTKMMAVL